MEERLVIDSPVYVQVENLQRYLDGLNEIRSGRLGVADVIGLDPAEVRSTRDELEVELEATRGLVEEQFRILLVNVGPNNATGQAVIDTYRAFLDGIVDVGQSRDVITQLANTTDTELNALLLSFVKATEESANVEQAFNQVDASLRVLTSEFTTQLWKPLDYRPFSQI